MSDADKPNLEDRLLEFLINHYPHMEARVGRLEGKLHVLMAMGGIALAGIIALVVRAW
jgi:hypothetical protein